MVAQLVLTPPLPEWLLHLSNHLCSLPLQASPAAVLGPLAVEAVAHIAWLRTHTTYHWGPMLLVYACVLGASVAMSASIDSYRRRQFMYSLRAGDATACGTAAGGLRAAAGCSDGDEHAQPPAAGQQCAAVE